MKTTHRHAFLLILTAFVLVISLFNTRTVFADDNVPPVEPVATEAPVVTDASSPTEETSPIIADQTSPESVPVSEVLEQLPEDTQVIVLNENGDVLPLATKGASEILVENDPMWCPVGVTPGDAGCTASYANVTDLIANLGSKSGAGTIYFAPTYSVNDAVFDHTNINLYALTDLTIQGGWNGSPGSAFSLSGSTTFNGVGLTITNWTNTVTINNIIVDEASGNGLWVLTMDDVVLNDISSNGNTREGIFIFSDGYTNVNGVSVNGNSYLGAFFNSAKGITFSGTNIFNNNHDGMAVWSNGDINVNGVSASGNTANGAEFSSDGPITFSGNNLIINNGQNGLIVASGSDINVNGVSASNNGGIGAQFYNDTGSGNIIFSGVNNFDNNGWGGIYAFSRGNISMENVTVNGNSNLDGARLQTTGNVCVSGSQFNSNGGFGILANDVSGSLTLNNVSFDGLNGYGDYSYGGTPIITSEGCNWPSVNINHPNDIKDTIDTKDTLLGALPLQVVRISSSDSAGFNCVSFSGTVLILPNGDKVTFKCPVEGSGSLSTLTKDGLPGNLPEGVEYVSGMQAVQSPDGSDKALDGQVIVSFLIPENMQGADLAILYWDGSQWLDLKSASFEDGRVVFNGGYVTGDGYFEAVTNFSGNFVLVAK